MFEKLFEALSGKAELSEDEKRDQARECSVALLVEAALSDGIYADVEHAAIRAMVKDTFGLDDVAADELVDRAEDRAESAVDQYAFTSVIKKYMPKQERVALVGHLWDVTLADGEESPFEDAFIRRAAALLAVTDRERMDARRAAVSRSSKD